MSKYVIKFIWQLNCNSIYDDYIYIYSAINRIVLDLEVGDILLFANKKSKYLPPSRFLILSLCVSPSRFLNISFSLCMSLSQYLILSLHVSLSLSLNILISHSLSVRLSLSLNILISHSFSVHHSLTILFSLSISHSSCVCFSLSLSPSLFFIHSRIVLDSAVFC